MPEKILKFLPEKKTNHPEKKIENVPEKTSNCPRFFFLSGREKQFPPEKKTKKSTKNRFLGHFSFSRVKKNADGDIMYLIFVYKSSTAGGF